MSLFNFDKMRQLKESGIRSHLDEYDMDDEDYMFLLQRESYESKLSAHLESIKEEMKHFTSLDERFVEKSMSKDEELTFIASNIHSILKLQSNIKMAKSTSFISQLADKIMSYTVKNNKHIFLQLKMIKRYLEKSEDKDKYFHEYYIETLKNRFPMIPSNLVDKINNSVGLDSYKTYLTRGVDFSKIQDAYPDWMLSYDTKENMAKYLDSKGNETFQGGTYNIRTCVSILERYLTIMVKETKQYADLVKKINKDLIVMNNRCNTAQNIAEKMCKSKEDLKIFEENIKQAHYYSQEVCIKHLETYNLAIQSVYIYYKNKIQDVIDEIYEDIPERFRKTGSDEGEF